MKNKKGGCPSVEPFIFFYQGSMHEYTHGYATIEKKRTLGPYDPWTNKDFVVGLNGYAKTNSAFGYPGNWGSGHYVCSGTFLVRNNIGGEAILSDWLKSDPGNFSWQHPWEQEILGRFILPKYEFKVVLLSYLVLGYPRSPFVRHLWGEIRDDIKETSLLYATLDNYFL